MSLSSIRAGERDGSERHGRVTEQVRGAARPPQDQLPDLNGLSTVRVEDHARDMLALGNHKTAWPWMYLSRHRVIVRIDTEIRTVVKTTTYSPVQQLFTWGL